MPANFVQPNQHIWEFNSNNLPTSGWYSACTSLSTVMADKMPSTYSEADRNWQWPEKTWFQQRLHSIKAKEHEQHRKPGQNSVKDALSAPASPVGIEPLKVD